MATPAKRSRFIHLSDEQLDEKQKAQQKDNTLANERKATRMFRAYLEEIGCEDTDFLNYSEEELDSHLAKF